MNDFIMNESDTIDFLLSLVFLFFIPFFLVGYRKKIFSNLTFKNFIITINRVLYFQFIIVLFVLFLIYIVQKITYISEDGLIIKICFSCIVLFIVYFPIVVLLNIINYFVRIWKK